MYILGHMCLKLGGGGGNMDGSRQEGEWGGEEERMQRVLARRRKGMWILQKFLNKASIN